MTIIANVIILFSLALILLSAVAFFKSTNIYLSAKLLLINNIYGISLLLIGLFLRNPSFHFLVQIFLLILLNLLVTLILIKNVKQSDSR